MLDIEEQQRNKTDGGDGLNASEMEEKEVVFRNGIPEQRLEKRSSLEEALIGIGLYCL